MKRLPVELSVPQSVAELAAAANIFREYGDSLGIDLSFQGFEEELATLPGLYAAPRGTLLLAWVDGELAGCCALRPLDDVDVVNAAEMKRLYVRPAFRRFGLGRLLAEAVIDAAQQMGYSSVQIGRAHV